MSKIRVLLVDDNAGFRQRMARLLRTQDDLDVVGEAADGSEAVILAGSLHPDVILMDFRMSGLDGFTAARTIAREHPAVRVFLLTAYPGALDKDKIARGGVAGLLIKDMPAAEIFEAIRSAAAPKTA